MTPHEGGVVASAGEKWQIIRIHCTNDADVSKV